MADDGDAIGPAPPRESYLDRRPHHRGRARRAAPTPIHPGYGFLSENAGFAEACAKAGLIFIGPPPRRSAAMGSKSAAKALMEKAGVPLVPGYHGADQALKARCKRAADKIGYPVLIKAVGRRRRQGHARVAAEPADFAGRARHRRSARRSAPSATTACWSRNT